MRRALVRRRFFVAGLSVAGMLLTFALVIATDASQLLGALVYAVWVMLIGVDAGIPAGVVAGGAGGAFWFVGTNSEGVDVTVSQSVARIAVLCVLGLGSGFVGNLLRTSETRRTSTLARQRALLDATIDGICLTDIDGNILIVNEPLVRMATDLGMPADGTVLDRLLSIADKLADPERYRTRMLEIAEIPGDATTDEFELQGTGRVFRGYTSPVSDRRGKAVGRIWTLREVTADKELERMRDAFVATVSHELRTPLTSISGFIEMLQDEEHGLGTSGRTYLEVIRRSTERLHHLVEDLLLVAQIEAQRVDLRQEPVDLAAIAERAVDAVRPWASEKRVRLEIDAGDVPAILGDERRIGQVLDNLLTNAIKFSNDGGTVRVELRGNGDHASLVVADTGIGIPAEEQGHVFSRFYRAQAASDLAVPGTGLGLAITRALVDQHGGTIDLESRVGEGTRVTVTLPTA
ncbi:MAG TPA: ATP-binding protein [Gaiellaceae bacterium]